MKAPLPGIPILRTAVIAGRTLLDIVYPSLCFLCERRLPLDERYICPECDRDLHPIGDADPLYKEERRRVMENGVLDDFLACYVFEKHKGMQNVIHAVKYQGCKELGVELGRRLGKVLEEHDIHTDHIVPLPLHPARLRERGYNQAEYIARGIAEVLSAPVRNDLLKRVRNTRSQTALTKEERSKNMKNAFSLASDKIDLEDRSVLLVDDLVTTGATLRSAAREIWKAKPYGVFGVSVAIAGWGHSKTNDPGEA